MHYGIFLGNSLGDKEAIILDLVYFTQVKFMTDWKLAVVFVHLTSCFMQLEIRVSHMSSRIYKNMLLMDGKSVL